MKAAVSKKRSPKLAGPKIENPVSLARSNQPAKHFHDWSLPKRILVPLDFSIRSNDTLEYARSFAKQFNARIVLIHVVEAFPIDFIVGLPSAKEANEHIFEQARIRLRSIENQLPGSRRDGDSVVVFGKPFQEIVRVAKEQSIDLIILATHGHTGLKHIQLGSTAERVVRHAHCPVLVLRAKLNSLSPQLPENGTARTPQADDLGPQKTKELALELHNILVPVDFSPRSEEALGYAMALARRFHAKIILLHVFHADYLLANSDYSAFDYPELIDELRRAGQKQLSDLAGAIPKRLQVTTILGTGHPGNFIVETAHKLAVDLIIIATHGRTGFKRALLGSTAEFVVRYVGCPVLTIRQLAPKGNNTSSKHSHRG